MRYALTEVEITHLRSVTVAEGETGIGILVRDRGIPVAFILAKAEAGTIAGEELRRLLMAEAGTEITHAYIRQELSPMASQVTPSPTVTVAVCTRDHPESLARTVSSLLGMALSDDGTAPDILIVDNAPSDQRTRRVAESFPQVRYVCEPKRGLDFARNRAIDEATGELLAYIDDDAVVDRYWLLALTAAFHHNRGAGAFTGPVVPFELDTTAQVLFEQRGGFGGAFIWKRFGSESAQSRSYPCDPTVFGTGCNMVFRRSLLVELGGFDDALDTGSPLPGGGDVDMFYRVVRAGAQLIHEPRLVVFHQHRRDYAALRRQMYTWGLGTMAYAVKHYRADAEFRVRFRCLMIGYCNSIVARGIRSLASGRGRNLDLILAELWGAVVGVCGEYDRSRRRVDRIRRQNA